MSAPSNVVIRSRRAWTTTPGGTTSTSPGKDRNAREPLTDILVLDTETTTDPSQRLTFGTYLHCTVSKTGRVTRVAEGIFHADDLERTDPVGYAALVEHCRTNRADIHRRSRRAVPTLTLISRSTFMDDVFTKLVLRGRAHMVMFNKPFDLSRLAVHAGAAKGSQFGAFSLKFWEQDLFHSRIYVKAIDSTKSLTTLSIPGRPNTNGSIDHKKHGVSWWQEGKTNHGNFLDLRTWAWSLTNRAFTLASACEAFGVEHAKAVTEVHGVITDDYIRYARRDVLATSELFEKLMAEHQTHPIDVEPTKAMSPASIAKGYQRSIGLVSRLTIDSERFTPEVMGHVMESLYGGRAECRIRHTSMPVEVHDFTSMYPTVNANMNLWSLLTATEIHVEDAADDLRKILAEVTLDSTFDRGLWPRLVGVAEIVPDGDVLPVRAPYGGTEGHTIGVNPATSNDPCWYTFADLVASTIITGKPPRVLRAHRFVGVGQLPSLTPVKLGGLVDFDPATQDFHTVVVEERARLKTITSDKAVHVEGHGCVDCRASAFLKVLANAGSFGIFVQFTPEERSPENAETVTVFSGSDAPFTTSTTGPENPGTSCFPPIAACITGAARLMLAMLERCVTEKGGTWVFCDTDSLAIVATEDGRLVPCPGGEHTDEVGVEHVRSLSFDECTEIRERFAGLSPYDPSAVRDLLKSEGKYLCLSVSAKRYALYKLVDGRVELEKGTEHGLGHLLNPEDPHPDSTGKSWIADAWRYRIAEHHGLNPTPPVWFDRPAVGSHTVSSPRLLQAFRHWNDGLDYQEQVKPFSFMIVAFVSGTGQTWNVKRLVAPYERDGSAWSNSRWVDLSHPREGVYRLTSDVDEVLNRPVDADGTRVVLANTYGAILAKHYRHPETKFLGPDWLPCSSGTVGLLRRWPTTIFASRCIGKESNRLDEVESGIMSEDPTAIYTPPLSALTDIAREVLSRANGARLLELMGDYPRELPPFTVRHVRRFVAGTYQHRATVRVVTALAALSVVRDLERLDVEQYGRVMVPARGLNAVDDPSRVLAEWSSRLGDAPRPVSLCECGCGVVVADRAKFSSAACRMRFRRPRRVPEVVGVWVPGS